MTDYEILGVNANAEQKEIKKAYFRLIRVHSPEKDPEKFQQIRAAYDRLTNSQTESQECFKFPLPDHPFANIYTENIVCELKQQNYKKAIKCAEEAILYTGENAHFLLLLALACEREGKFGKAAKQYEKIWKEYPDNYSICGRLAVAYFYRGYYKKAWKYFETAYNEGMREHDFLTVYLSCANDNNKFQQAEQALLDILKSSKNQDYRKNAEEYCWFFQQYCLGNAKKYKHIPTVLEYYYLFTKAVLKHFREHEGEFTFLFLSMRSFLINAGKQDDENFEKVSELLVENCFDKDLLEVSNGIYMHEQICNDNRFSEMIRIISECYLLPFDQEDELEKLQERFAKLDVRLCLIEEWEELKSEFAIIQKEYPDFYHKLDDVWKAMAAGEKVLEHFEERLLKEYDRLEKNFSNAFFYKRHPEKCPLTEVLQWDSFETGTFQREGKKIGRNDPCPCGSGKKYKKCCGK